MDIFKKKGVLAAVAALVVVSAAAVIFFPRGEIKVSEPEVISKRVRISTNDIQPSQQPQTTMPPVESLTRKVEPQAAINSAKPAADKPAIKMELPEEKKAEPEVKKSKDEASVRPGKRSEKGRNARISKPWAVNVASFSNQKEAQSLAATLKASGYRAYVTEFKRNGKDWHRVRVGFYKTIDDAKKVSKKMEVKYKSHGSWVVRPSATEILAHTKR